MDYWVCMNVEIEGNTLMHRAVVMVVRVEEIFHFVNLKLKNFQ